MSEAAEEASGATDRRDTLSPDRLAAAVDAGILTGHQADRLAEFWQAPEALTPSGADLSFADREEVRFVRGFHDIFISIGLVIVLAGLTFALRDVVPAYAIAAADALAIWGLAELFSKRMRLALPSFLLAVAFLPAFFLACFGLVVDESLWAISKGSWANRNEAVLVVPATLVVIAATVLFYLRFRVPVGIAAITASVLFFVAAVTELVFPGAVESYYEAFLLVMGLVTFTLAMAFDCKDPGRVTLNADKAFWLHLLAAPLIVHAILRFVSDLSGEGSAAYSVAVIGLFLLLSAVALIVDRRALLVSAMSYLGFAIGYLILETNLSEEAAVAATLLVLGGFILLIGSGWHVLRRGLLRPFAGHSLLRYLPSPA